MIFPSKNHKLNLKGAKRVCWGEYAEEINNSRGIYYEKYIRKAGDGKRKSIQDERVKVLGSATYSEINVI